MYTHDYYTLTNADRYHLTALLVHYPYLPLLPLHPYTNHRPQPTTPSPGRAAAPPPRRRTPARCVAAARSSSSASSAWAVRGMCGRHALLVLGWLSSVQTSVPVTRPGNRMGTGAQMSGAGQQVPGATGALPARCCAAGSRGLHCPMIRAPPRPLVSRPRLGAPAEFTKSTLRPHSGTVHEVVPDTSW